MFTLKKTKVKLNNVNVRAEIHGEESRLACDLAIEVKLGNDCLAEFDARLKDALFWRNKNTPQPDLLEASGIDEKHWKPNLKFPLMSPIKWESAGVGYTCTVHWGIDDKTAIVLPDCKVDGYKFTPMEGGTVVINCRVVAHPDPEGDALTRLCSLIQKECDITLGAPEEE